ncbi:potassium channel subfamily K member 5-like isoform X2 [Megalops cyprinoides]|uniref:potassium channel subfamily K member 5-like isoform X2 n=1 Tax=Megalops cyprinoides TaxID=118141 RepID=UPI001865679F|nr:potassium channel subfamily K member 5-like isoform X2 [Megalops cyprinoides]
MVDKGPVLTSAIIFYLSIGAAVFQVLEEPNWKISVSNYATQKEKILQAHPCLTKDDLDKILEVVANAAGQGVTITGNKTFNSWNWPKAVVFAATIITTIGYGNIAPKTIAGRVFCIFYGLFGIPLCLTWISELGKFFRGRAKHLGQYLIRKGLTVEGWSYVEGLYFSFVTLTTIGFGDIVAGVNPNIDYPAPYRYFVELWIYMGLAWLSLFFTWKVHMVVKAHKALKRRRRRHKSLDELQSSEEHKSALRRSHSADDVNIFNFLSEEQEDYGDLVQQIGAKRKRPEGGAGRGAGRSHSCSEGGVSGVVLSLERSPRRRRRFSVGDCVSTVLSRTRSYLMGESGVILADLSEDLHPEENQLDREAAGGAGRPRDSRKCHARVFRSANIIINEENLLDINSTETKLTAPGRTVESEDDLEQEQRSLSSDGSVFAVDRCHSYQRLVEDCSKKGTGS